MTIFNSAILPGRVKYAVFLVITPPSSSGEICQEFYVSAINDSALSFRPEGVEFIPDNFFLFF